MQEQIGWSNESKLLKYILNQLKRLTGLIYNQTSSAFTGADVPALWKEITPPNVIPEWVQPLGAEDAYALGARVTHNLKTWESTVEANVWEPGVYGWVEI